MCWMRTVRYRRRYTGEYMQIEESQGPLTLGRTSTLAVPLISLRLMFTSSIRASKYLAKLGCEKRSSSVPIWLCRFALKMCVTKADFKASNNLIFLIKKSDLCKRDVIIRNWRNDFDFNYIHQQSVWLVSVLSLKWGARILVFSLA